MPEWIVSFPERLDAFLGSEGRMQSRAKAQHAIAEGHVLVNNDIVLKPAHRLQEGDVVQRTEATQETAPSTIVPVDIRLVVLYEDPRCLVLQKPAGIAVHPGAGIAPNEITLLSGIAFLFQERGLPFSAHAVLAHRLDKDTTGCLLIAKDPEAHAFLQRQFEERTVRKLYLALVAGIPSPAAAHIDAPIGRHSLERTRMTVLGAIGERPAQTMYRTIATASAANAALLACELHTGRTHQIRVHLSTIGHPILGDSTYTSTLSERLTGEFSIRSSCLHAWRLRFTSPADQQEREVEAPIPSAFQSVLRSIGISALLSRT